LQVRSLFKTLMLGLAAVFVFCLWLVGNSVVRHNPQSATAGMPAPSTALRAGHPWGNPASLPDHFARHGGDFGARNAEEYAGMAAELLQRAKAEGLPAKVDDEGVLRVFDPRTGAFGAYNRDGTTKTFFKPGSRGYFERQPGQPVNLQTWRQK
jgi:pyocin large subunit-like protein